jgi:2-polyprenyl-3-methyl-5-hydroxy-6-metoxy-1,4-benzoquinol methylase
MKRNERCPLCESATELLLQLSFNVKLNLPTKPEIRYCSPDNFLFVASGSQPDYDEYYKSLANDTVHGEVAGGNLRSPISILQMSHLVPALGDFFSQPRKVLDFGCGEASLLVELASEFPSSTFVGFDPGPAAQIGSNKATVLGLRNLLVADLNTSIAKGPFDLVIASHVVEHLLDFDLLNLLSDLLTPNGLLYIEVPNSLQYETRNRQEFLYYFDRLHVNHFTPQSLARLAAAHGFGNLSHLEYAFPYRDGGEYPALGMHFQKGQHAVEISSASLLEASQRYIAKEKARAKTVSAEFENYEGVLVWGAGDNFFRSIENGGPLYKLPNMIVLDRRPQEITIGNRKFATENPQESIQRYPWPVVVTVSEGRKSIGDQVTQIDPSRRIFFV